MTTIQIPDPSETEDLRNAADAPSFDQMAWEQRCTLRHHAGSSLRYYRRRQKLFDWLDKLTKILTIAAATTFLAELIDLRKVAGSLAFLTLMDLIIGYGDRRNQHQRAGDMAAELLDSIESTPIDRVTTTTAAQWGGMYARLLAYAPPTLKCLKLICEREQSLADGLREHADAHNPEQPIMRRVFAHVW